MKLQFKALSIILGLAAFLGTCASAQSGTPDINSADSNVENSAEVVPQEIKLGDPQETQEVQDAEAEVSEDHQNTEDTTQLEAVEEVQGAEVEVSEDNNNAGDAELEAAKEIQDAETAEIETPELEAVEESESVEESSSTEETLDNRVETVKKGVEDGKSQF
ncbi:MAG: hypothetical protein KME09_07270 [Pleurocapsa minor HA4230-MV1]|jgi:uncharacterized cupredoxin-like copper-binding protein|nr:hypothetical protein [Pleurocapsa minor HA4230-MV1]